MAVGGGGGSGGVGVKVKGEMRAAMIAIEKKFVNWKAIGEQYTDPLPANEALPPAEIAVCRNKGIEFVKELGSGGYGKVWQVRCSQLLSAQPHRNYVNEDMACKIMSILRFKRHKTPAKATSEMLTEYSLHKRLQHPYLVRSEDAFHIVDAMTGFPYVRHLHFMELCAGNLRDLLKSMGKMGESEAKSWFRMMCDALRYLHRQNISHLDIKLDNILYLFDPQTSAAEFKLSDLGLARSCKFISGRIGTEIYMAPEQPTRAKILADPLLSRAIYATQPCDIYSLALAVCETLGGVKTHIQTKQLVIGIKNEQILRRVHILGTDINTLEFCQLLQGMLATDPKTRFNIEQVAQHPWYLQP
ncbi:serine/threonine-protein kinase Chk2-like [Oppia nitens]|uniref:serine/threonine-protein kinase Chk2-like n=1 Tax=Oppia nitens TaxID=1686743 RepID=UPI0023DA023A|nr:serine/threonine-protein kinase Chk2-like [Oppia nitens]